MEKGIVPSSGRIWSDLASDTRLLVFGRCFGFSDVLYIPFSLVLLQFIWLFLPEHFLLGHLWSLSP